MSITMKNAIFVAFMAIVATATGTTTPVITSAAMMTTDIVTTDVVSTDILTTDVMSTDILTSENSTTPNTTTPSVSTMTITTTIPPTTSPYGAGTWDVKGADNKTCMMMSFQGKITVKNVNNPVLIPRTALAASSKCDEGNSDFVLDFEDEGTAYFISLRFTLQDKVTMYMWNSSIMSINPDTMLTMSGSQLQVSFQTPVGKSYQCREQTIRIGANFNLTLTDMRLQPFATLANNDFGDPFSCETPSSPNAALIVGLVLGAVIFILLIAIGVLVKKSSKPGRGYNNFT